MLTEHSKEAFPLKCSFAAKSDRIVIFQKGRNILVLLRGLLSGYLFISFFFIILFLFMILVVKFLFLSCLHVAVSKSGI